MECTQPCICTQVPAPAFSHMGLVYAAFCWSIYIGASTFKAVWCSRVWLPLTSIPLANIFRIFAPKFDTIAFEMCNGWPSFPLFRLTTITNIHKMYSLQAISIIANCDGCCAGGQLSVHGAAVCWGWAAGALLPAPQHGLLLHTRAALAEPWHKQPMCTQLCCYKTQTSAARTIPLSYCTTPLALTESQNWAGWRRPKEITHSNPLLKQAPCSRSRR